MERLSIEKIEALILISLATVRPRLEVPYLGQREMSQLRLLVSHPEFQTITLVLNYDELQAIESRLPLFGTVDEGIYSPIRIKVSAGIYHYLKPWSKIEWWTIKEQDKEADNATDTDPHQNGQPCEDCAAACTRPCAAHES